MGATAEGTDQWQSLRIRSHLPECNILIDSESSIWHRVPRGRMHVSRIQVPGSTTYHHSQVPTGRLLLSICTTQGSAELEALVLRGSVHMPRDTSRIPENYKRTLTGHFKLVLSRNQQASHHHDRVIYCD